MHITTQEQLDTVRSETDDTHCCCNQYELLESLQLAFDREQAKDKLIKELQEYINGPCKDAVKEAFL